MGAKTLEAQIADGTAKVEGDVSVLAQLAATMVDFDPRFEIMPGTKALTEIAHADPFRPCRAKRSPSSAAGPEREGKPAAWRARRGQGGSA